MQSHSFFLQYFRDLPMTTSQRAAYTLVQNCLKEALYANWRQDPHQRNQYLHLAEDRLRELRRHQRTVFLGNYQGDRRSLYLGTRELMPLFQSISQYARISRRCRSNSHSES